MTEKRHKADSVPTSQILIVSVASQLGDGPKLLGEVTRPHLFADGQHTPGQSEISMQASLR